VYSGKQIRGHGSNSFFCYTKQASVGEWSNLPVTSYYLLESGVNNRNMTRYILTYSGLVTCCAVNWCDCNSLHGTWGR